MEYKKFLDNDFSLMKKFKEVATGSQKHCEQVAGICDAIINELDSNDIDREALRCASLYHDVGKIFNPNYFSENQDENNPHDDLDPFISYQIITRHVSDSVALLSQYGFPQNVRDIVSQHHGNSLMKHFFDASEIEDESQFCYKWSPPQSIEASILMLVDIVESSARSAWNNNKLNTNESKQELVNRTIDRLMESEQIDKLTVGVYRVVRKILPEQLKTIFQKRVEYITKDEGGKDE